MARRNISDERIKLFVEFRSHARHLEVQLQSFTQWFLILTGALWGYFLSKSSPSDPVQSVMGDQVTFEFWVFLAHLVFTILGSFIVVRSSINFEANFEAANRALRLTRHDDYETDIKLPNGPIKLVNFIRNTLSRVKAFLILLYVVAAGVDWYFIARVKPAFQLGWPSVTAMIWSSGLFLVDLFMYSWLDPHRKVSERSIKIWLKRWTGVILALYCLFFLVRKYQEPCRIFPEYFANSENLRVGAPVQIAGVKVGSVRSIELCFDHKSAATVKVDVEINPPYKKSEMENACAYLKTAGVPGDTFIDIDLSKAKNFCSSSETFIGRFLNH